MLSSKSEFVFFRHPGICRSRLHVKATTHGVVDSLTDTIQVVSVTSSLMQLDVSVTPNSVITGVAVEVVSKSRNFSGVHLTDGTLRVGVLFDGYSVFRLDRPLTTDAVRVDVDVGGVSGDIYDLHVQLYGCDNPFVGKAIELFLLFCSFKYLIKSECTYAVISIRT